MLLCRAQSMGEVEYAAWPDQRPGREQPSHHGDRPVGIERGVLAIDQPPPLRRIARRKKGCQGNVDKQGVGVICVAISKRQLHRFDDRMNRVRGVVSHRLQVDGLEYLQSLEQVGALRPWTALVDGQTMISHRHGFLDSRRMCGQIDVADQASVGTRPGVNSARDRPAVKRVRHEPQPSCAVTIQRVGAIGTALSLGLDQYFERPRKIGMPGEWPRRPLQEGLSGRNHLRERHRAEAVEQGQAGIERRRDGRRFNTPGGNTVGTSEMIKRRQPWRGPLPRDHRDSLSPCIENQDRYFTTETERPPVRDTQSQDRRSRRVRRVATLLEDFQSGRDCITAAGRHGSLTCLGVPVLPGGATGTKI